MSSHRNGIVRIDTLDDYGQFDEIIDVRSPGEFADDHLPGSINCPVLSDAQRAEVGTLYKQQSPFDARKIGAAYVAENIARHLRETFHDRPRQWSPLILCWRGGQRSGAMTLILRKVGWDAQQLEGGYKRYRGQVIDALARLPQAFRFKVICGPTGSGKSRILQALARRGAQVLDLEALACHKGSVLGPLPGAPQPSQKHFETCVLDALRGFDPGRPVFAEAESRKIGCLQLPDTILAALHAGECITIDATPAARVAFLLCDYSYFLDDPATLIARLETLGHLHSRDTITRWRGLAEQRQWPALVSELLATHYDPHYRRSQRNHYSGLAAPTVLATDDLSPPAIDALAEHVLTLFPTND